MFRQTLSLIECGITVDWGYREGDNYSYLA